MAGDVFPWPDPPPLADPSNENGRTVPDWMDHMGMHGQRIILSLSTVDNKPLPRNPFIVSKSIEQVGAKIEAARTEEKGAKYVLTTRNAAHAKKLTEMKELIDGTKVQIIPHPTLNTSRCVVSCREVIEMDENELQKELALQGVTNVRRITRMEGKDRVSTPTLVLTVHGTVVPKYIMFGPLRIPTRLFYPSPMICFNCSNYGHTKMKCTNVALCRNCSESHTATPEGCKNDPFCKNCKGTHPPTSRKCPLFVKEERIIKIKIESGLSFAEARKEYAKRHGEGSYAAVAGAQERLEGIRTENEKDQEIRGLKEEIRKMKELMANGGTISGEDAKDREIQRLRAEVAEMKNIVEQFKQLKADLQKASKDQDISGSDVDLCLSEQEHDVRASSSMMEIELTPEQRSTKRWKSTDELETNDSDPQGSEGEPEDKENGNKTAPPKAKRGRGRPKKQQNV